MCNCFYKTFSCKGSGVLLLCLLLDSKCLDEDFSLGQTFQPHATVQHVKTSLLMLLHSSLFPARVEPAAVICSHSSCVPVPPSGHGRVDVSQLL